MGQESGEIREQIEETRSEMGGTVQAIADKADVKGRMKESIADKRDRLKDQMSGAGTKMSDATPDAEQVRGGAKRAAGIAQENPLGLALGGVAVGFLAGMALPTTRIEDERIGPMADDVKELAKDAGQEAVDRGRQVAQEAASSAVETARESGQEQAGELRDSVAEQAGVGESEPQGEGSRQPVSPPA